MSKYTAEQLAELSGEKDYKQSQFGGKYFDAITLGKDGKFYIAFYSQPKDERDEPDILGDEVRLTIIKVRRKINKWVDGVNVLESVEYDAGTELIHTTGGAMSEKNAKGHGGKVSLIVYAIFGGEIVKFTVSGGSLYNPDDEEDMRLYSYLQSFEDDEHTFMFETIVCAKENIYTDKDGFETTNYQMTFKRGKFNESLELVGDKLNELKEVLKENDSRDSRWLGASKGSKEMNDVSKSSKELEYPKEDINPDDIPF